MRIERKKELDRVRIIHNKKLLWVIIILIIALVVLVFFIVRNYANNPVVNTTSMECSVDSDCAPKCGCHADSCVLLKQRGECEKRLFCTQECSGPLDCNSGHCGCLNGKCSVIKN